MRRFHNDGFRRIPVPQPVQQTGEYKTFPGPFLGWVVVDKIADPEDGAALVLENWLPTKTGAVLRKGTEQFATIAARVRSLFSYRSGAINEIFASDTGNIYNITAVADPDVAETPVVADQISGYYSMIQFETAAGDFLYCVNGTDSPRLYDGTNFFIINAEITFSLPYDAETGNFTINLIVTGGTSGATATIVEIIDNGTSGILFIQAITGTFTDGEVITDTTTGSADADIPSGVGTYNSIVITNVVTSTLVQVFVYRNRIYFIEDNSMSAWYLPVDVLGGAATELSLRGVFQHGGKLLFGGTWSIDAGDGIDDKAVFVSDQGEVAVYQGSFPGGTDWTLVGRYEIANPLGKNGTMRAGGDLLIIVEDGIVPMSEIFNKDKAALSLAAITRDIEPEWLKEVVKRDGNGPWEILKWPAKNIAIVSPPAASIDDDLYNFVVNIETGKWAKWTYNIQCMTLHDGDVYCGRLDGKIRKMESTGSDDGEPYVATYVQAFNGLKKPADQKQVHMARATFRASQGFIPKVSMSTDYNVVLPAAPPAALTDTASLWDTGIWDTAIWDSTLPQTVTTNWVSLGVNGATIAPQVQVTCGSAIAPDAELLLIDLLYESGGIVV